jgi:hypothetical protein
VEKLDQAWVERIKTEAVEYLRKGGDIDPTYTPEEIKAAVLDQASCPLHEKLAGSLEARNPGLYQRLVTEQVLPYFLVWLVEKKLETELTLRRSGMVQDARSQAALEVYGPYLEDWDNPENSLEKLREAEEESDQEGLEELAAWSGGNPDKQ